MPYGIVRKSGAICAKPPSKPNCWLPIVRLTRAINLAISHPIYCRRQGTAFRAFRDQPLNARGRARISKSNKALVDLKVPVLRGCSAIERVPVGAIVPDPHNPRAHPREQVRAIARSMETFGFNAPILVDRAGTIKAGHGRFEAAKLLKMEQVPIIRLEHLSETQAKAYMLADNKLTLQGIGSSTAWRKLIEKRNVSAGFNLTLQDDPYLPTDVTSFYPKTIPVLNFFTGAHEDYHRPTDTADKINYEGAERIGKFARAIVLDLVSAQQRPDFAKVAKVVESACLNAGYMAAVYSTSEDFDRERQELVSRAAGLAYPIRGGVPVMLPDEARPLSDEERDGRR